VTSLVWKTWAPPKEDFFAWLVIQNRIWTADRIDRRGWPNCEECRLCNRVQETASHLLFKCWFTIRIWSKVKEWLVLHDVEPNSWQPMCPVKELWGEMIRKKEKSRKSIASIAMLVPWKIWQARKKHRSFEIMSLP
jgi:hypothetical protein